MFRTKCDQDFKDCTNCKGLLNFPNANNNPNSPHPSPHPCYNIQLNRNRKACNEQIGKTYLENLSAPCPELQSPSGTQAPSAIAQALHDFDPQAMEECCETRDQRACFQLADEFQINVEDVENACTYI